MKSNVITCVLGMVLAASPAFGDLYTQDFEADSTASWTINGGLSDYAANFFFDYSSVGIPAAPSGAGTHGMKLQSNLTNGVFAGMSALDLEFRAKTRKMLFDQWTDAGVIFDQENAFIRH